MELRDTMAGWGTMLQMGIDARLALFVPLSTLCAVVATALLLSLPVTFADPSSLPLALLLYAGTGLALALAAWPVTVPLSLAVWIAMFAAMRRKGIGEHHAAMIAAVPAGGAGAVGFGAHIGTDGVAIGLVALAMPGVIIGSLLAAYVIYRQGAT